MTSEQAAQLIAQNDEFLKNWLPLVKFAVHDIFPACAVGFSLWLGITFGRLAV